MNKNAVPIKDVVRIWDGWFLFSHAPNWPETVVCRGYKTSGVGHVEFVGNDHRYTLDELKEAYPEALIAELPLGIDQLLR